MNRLSELRGLLLGLSVCFSLAVVLGSPVAGGAAVADLAAEPDLTGSERQRAQEDSDLLGRQEATREFGGVLTDAKLVETVVGKTSVAEWLGPLAPVALSPFFGMACLSGLACLEARGVIPENKLLARAGPLRKPWVFFVFLGLALMTSLPRLTKVSKPMAQAVDGLETYSAVVILVILRFSLRSAQPVEEIAMLHADVLGDSMALFWSAVAALNVLAVRAVRVFFEILAWISPVPFIDALLEAGNKALCAGLMAVYAFSPMLAAAVDVLLFAGSALCYFWIHRRVVYFKAVFVGPLVAKLFGRRAPMPAVERGLPVFCAKAWGSFEAKQKLRLLHAEGGWSLNGRSLFGRKEMQGLEGTRALALRRGWLAHTITGGPVELQLSKRFDGDLEGLCAHFGLDLEALSEPRSADAAVLELT